ncbi:MAG: 50S ribosomal protein L23 [Candidatus Aenigmarchaeota archaeon]|nr:50S ribosomal protein L23 [Candidatus Aenigmarchaeota archaeon]
MAEETKRPLVDPWTIILQPYLTEKSIGKIETENKLVFIVNRKSTKKNIKWAVQKALDVKVEKIQTTIDQKGRKKAWIKLAKGFSASDIATRFGML